MGQYNNSSATKLKETLTGEFFQNPEKKPREGAK
jgi:hypothetical protein